MSCFYTGSLLPSNYCEEPSVKDKILDISKVQFNDKNRRRIVKQIIKQHKNVALEYSGYNNYFGEGGVLHSLGDGMKYIPTGLPRYRLTYENTINGEQHEWLLLDGDISFK